MPAVRVRGIDIYYEEHGSTADPCLIMAHGLLGSIAATPRFGERADDIAARGLHVVSYDARGHGRSGYTTRRSDYRWAAMAEDLAALMQALGIDRASVYGGSMGAGTALMLALAHPERVERLILQSPPPFGTDVKAARQTLGGLATLYQLFGTSVAARIVMALPRMRRIDREGAAGDMREFLARQRRAAIVPAIRGVLGGPSIPVERLGEITQQTLVLTHPDDAIHPLRSGEILHERMLHAKLAVAPSATYWQENPAALTHVVASFIRGEEVARGLPRKAPHDHAPA